MVEWITNHQYVWLNPVNDSHIFSGQDFERFMKDNDHYGIDVFDNDYVALSPCTLSDHRSSFLFGIIILTATTLKDFVDIFYVYEYHFTRPTHKKDKRTNCQRT